MELLSYEQFQTLSTEDIRKLGIIPETFIWADGGTRRGGTMEKIPTYEYIEWATQNQLSGTERIMSYGVQDLFMPVLGPRQLREQEGFSKKALLAINALFSDRFTNFAEEIGCRVRFIGVQHISPESAEMCQKIEEKTANYGEQTIWWMVHLNEEIVRMEAINKLIARGEPIPSMAEAINFYYGKQISQQGIYLGFGKPHSGYWVPPFLDLQLQCYWADFPISVYADDRDFRNVFYDYAFTRKTWIGNKEERNAKIDGSIIPERTAEHYVVGVGSIPIKEETGFWYQEPIRNFGVSV